ncbi:MAG TPA: hypothetical protein VF597_01145 [Candidatus Saccharimonadales bacterium]|jgi:protein-disulfide isomerase-like protein with CxxC motif
MRTVAIYREQSEVATATETFMRDFERQTGHTIEVIDPDSRDGAELCRTYDIVEYPSLVVLDDNGVMQQLWRGLPMPLISEVSFYAR